MTQYQTATTRSNLLMLLTALIWGLAFVAQRISMDYIGPFLFNGIRFAMGSLSLIPLIIYRRKHYTDESAHLPLIKYILPGFIAGGVLFLGASFQQVGMVYTDAGKAGFITGLYVVLVPVIGIFWGHRTTSSVWYGVILAVAGLYLLSVTEKLSEIVSGDVLVLIGAFFWANHVLVIAKLSPDMDTITLASSQFAFVSILSFAGSAINQETYAWQGIADAMWPILYGGFMSVGVAFTLQVVAQKTAHPAYVAIILSLETVFAAFGGWLILDEQFTPRIIAGCLMMLAGIVVAQLPEIRAGLKQNRA
ncbi:MAG TPA: EamA family transporter [Bacteroidales bacterium]|nr:MAG: hypothetical protein A2X11_15345 [Bacteroidetes bacterium GWE2_42_24]OFY31716.1 MAG: hypothetical protein A2X09_09090 [Bacteroidetes bacterium GWF2_43_11]HBZ67017.1 EamA family transporter [Bacteroidales bacterium]